MIHELRQQYKFGQQRFVSTNYRWDRRRRFCVDDTWGKVLFFVFGFRGCVEQQNVSPWWSWQFLVMVETLLLYFDNTRCMANQLWINLVTVLRSETFCQFIWVWIIVICIFKSLFYINPLEINHLLFFNEFWGRHKIQS